MSKALILAFKLVGEINDSKWDDANDTCLELMMVLGTYKRSC